MSETFSFRCPSCYDCTLSVPVSVAGKKGQCPKCQALVEIPQPQPKLQPKLKVTPPSAPKPSFVAPKPRKTSNINTGAPKSPRKNRQKQNISGMSIEGEKSTGQIISNAFEIVFSKNVLSIIQVFLVLWIPGIIIQVLGIGASRTSPYAMVIPTLILFLLFPISAGAATRIIADIYQQKAVSVGDAIRAGLRKCFTLIGSMILLMLIFMGIYILIIAVGYVILMILPKTREIVTLAGLTLVVVFAWVYSRVLCSLIATIPATIIENLGALSGIKRSRELSEGHRLRAFMIFLTYFVIVLVPTVIGIVLLGRQTFLLNQPVLFTVINFIITAIANMFLSVAIVIYYFDLRVRKENFGIDELASIFD